MPTINEIIDAPGIRKVALLVPMRGKIDSIFMQTYLSLFIHLLKKRGIVAQPVFSDMMPLDKARCSLVKSAILNKSDYALWLDSDVVIKEAMFDRLWETIHEKDGTPDERFIVSGIYYEREIPYDAVIRRKNELGLYEKIMQFPDKPFTVDGIGFGMVLMKIKPMKDAFVATKGYPFRWTDKVSEDLFFCDLVTGGGSTEDGKPLSYKIWVDPQVQVPHYGSYVTQWHYLHNKLDEYSDVKEISRYLKIPLEECYQRCLGGALAMCKEWQKTFGKDRKEDTIPEAEILDFYRKTEIYLYDLTWFWSHNRRQREEIMGRWKDSKQVLDFGCGIGDYGLAYAEDHLDAHVDFYDINKPNVDYLKYRIKVRETQGTINPGNCKAHDEASFLEREEHYDQILCLDLLEHTKNPEVYASKLRRMLKRNGTLIAVVSPKGMFQPQHVSEIDLSKCGFLQIDTYVYIRTDSDTAKNYAKIVQNVKDSMTTSPMEKVNDRRGD